MSKQPTERKKNRKNEVRRTERNAQEVERKNIMLGEIYVRRH